MNERPDDHKSALKLLIQEHLIQLSLLLNSRFSKTNNIIKYSYCGTYLFLKFYMTSYCMMLHVVFVVNDMLYQHVHPRPTPHASP